MSDPVNLHEQALVAVLAEIDHAGYDIDKLVESVTTGVMGNKPYTWVGAKDKSNVLEALSEAVKAMKSS